MYKLTKSHSYKIYFLMLGGILFILFIVYSYFVAREYLNKVDFDTTVKLQNHIPLAFDPFFSSLSLLGSIEVSGSLYILLTIFISRKKWKRLIFILGFFLFHSIEIVFKSLIDQIGPPFMFHRYSFNYHFPSGYLSSDFYSYPSGHVGRIAMLVGLLSIVIWKSRLNKWIKYFLFLISFAFFSMMFVSRISLGEHWVSDAIGGAFLGFSLTLISYIVW